MKHKINLVILTAVFAGLTLGCSQPAKTPDWQHGKALAEKLDHPGAMTSDDKNLYFVTGGTIASLNEGTSGVWKMPLAGGPPVQLFKGYQKDEKTLILPDTFVMVTDEKYVYFSAASIYRVPKDGGPAEEITRGMPTEMAVDKDRIYWHNFVGEGMTSTPAYSADKKGGEPKSMTGTVNISAIAIDDAFLYWSQPDGVYKMPKTGGEVAKVYAAPDKQSVSGLAADADDLYFTLGDGRNKLMRVSKKGGDATKIADAINHAQAFYANGVNVYFVLNEGTFGTSLNRVAKTGGPVTKLDSGYLANFHVTKDKVYVADIATIFELPAN